MRLTGGRFASLLPMPTGVIDTRDARNGNRHRRCVLYFHGERITVIPTKRRLWATADRFFPPSVTYRRRAARTGRTIPILQLLPA
jgi:hypothetical protein